MVRRLGLTGLALSVSLAFAGCGTEESLVNPFVKNADAPAAADVKDPSEETPTPTICETLVDYLPFKKPADNEPKNIRMMTYDPEGPNTLGNLLLDDGRSIAEVMQKANQTGGIFTINYFETQYNLHPEVGEALSQTIETRLCETEDFNKVVTQLFTNGEGLDSYFKPEYLMFDMNDAGETYMIWMGAEVVRQGDQTDENPVVFVFKPADEIYQAMEPYFVGDFE